MIEIILGVVVCISLLLLLFIICNNGFQLAIIKIDKAEEDIRLYLDKKKDLLLRAKQIIIKELKIESFLDELDESFDEYNNFKINSILKNCYNELFKITDENDKLMKSDTLLSILDELNVTEENIVGAIKFYNDTVVQYNKLIVSFPSRIVAFIKRYKKLEFYNNEKREIFEIMKER